VSSLKIALYNIPDVDETFSIETLWRQWLCIGIGIKIITINWNIAISRIYEWMKCCQKRKIINEWFILLREIILLGKSQLVASHSLKLDVNRCFWNQKKYNFTLQKATIFGQTMTIIIITIIKHHNSKHYIYSIFIKTETNWTFNCLHA
jgi:hypothetical protein